MKFQIRKRMEHLRQDHPFLNYAGLAAICLGVVLMVAGYLLGWTNHNWVLFLALGLILAGVFAEARRN